MSGQRQKIRPEQGVLAFPTESRSEAPMADVKGTEMGLIAGKYVSFTSFFVNDVKCCQRLGKVAFVFVRYLF